EVISKRKIDERYYIDLDDPTYFYIEKSTIPINYKKDGYFRAIDYSLHNKGHGLYQANQQPFPTSIDINNSNTTLEINGREMKFNQYTLKQINMDNSIIYHDANWSNISITNFSAIIENIFPEIDLEISFFEGAIKSDFIIKQNLNVKELIFLDQLNLSTEMGIIIDDQNPLNQNYLQIYDTETSENIAIGHPALTHDSSPEKTTWISPYFLNGNTLGIVCDSLNLNDPNHQYPITVDPLFTAIGPSAGTGSGSLLAPSTCTNDITISYPGGSTPWDVSLSWNILANFCAEPVISLGVIEPCFMSEGQIWFTSSCGGVTPAGAPAFVWKCSPPGPLCDASGNWGPTLGFGLVASTQSLAQCYTPSCSNQNMTFTSNLNRLDCISGFGFDDCVFGNSYCVTLTAWSVTVQGRSVETLGNTATGNGNQAIYDNDCLGTQTLNPTPLYGVGGYVYNWNNSLTTPTITVPGAISTYTCVVTDACGTSVTATFDIGCPLSIDLSSFSATKVLDKVRLDWQTLSELNTDYFIIERSNNQADWREIGKLSAKGDTENKTDYQFYDEYPLVGPNYYRLKLYNKDGNFEFTETIEIEFENEFVIYPNPAIDNFSVFTRGTITTNSEIILLDIFGKEIRRKT
ncbi:MAG: hypothetical protein MK066_14860, partial [Crocinitomicaceae bacterium]|nr:hypothetical protein [Crocinitomicaceae bacterium]